MLDPGVDLQDFGVLVLVDPEELRPLDLEIRGFPSQFLDKGAVRHGEDHLGPGLIVRDLRDLLELGLRRQALSLRLEVALVEIHDLLGGDLPLFFQPENSGLHAVVLEGHGGLLHLRPQPTRLIREPGHRLAGALHPELEVVLEVGGGHGICDLGRERRVGLLDLDQDEPRVPPGLHDERGP